MTGYSSGTVPTGLRECPERRGWHELLNQGTKSSRQDTQAMAIAILEWTGLV